MLNIKHRLNRKEAMVNPFDPERDEMPFEDENDPFSRTLEDFTLTGKLRRFHEAFDSSIRAILQDCLFRIQEENGALTFQILCPNEIIQKRLYVKREKIRNTLRWIWGDLDYYALCVEKNGALQCRIMATQRDRGGI